MQNRQAAQGGAGQASRFQMVERRNLRRRVRQDAQGEVVRLKPVLILITFPVCTCLCRNMGYDLTCWTMKNPVM